MPKPHYSVKVGEGHLVAFMFPAIKDKELRVALYFLQSLEEIPDILSSDVGITVLDCFDYGKYSILKHKDHLFSYIKAFDEWGNEVFRRVVRFAGVVN